MNIHRLGTSRGTVAARRRTVLLVAILAVWAAAGSTASAGSQTAQVVRVAYPEEPQHWYPMSSEEGASIDLTALWGLPLYRFDPAGQLRPALAQSARIEPESDDGSWTVEVTLGEGTWSDDRPVTAHDVVATLDAIREQRQGHLLRPLVGAEAVDDRRVRLEFDRPYARWASLVSGAFTVMPAHVLEEHGVDAYTDGVPVAGGPFVLVDHEPGLRAVFEARAGSPVGEAVMDRVEVWFTPSYETALGLLRDRRVDIVAGYLAINPVERAARVEGARAGAPLGGTWAGIAIEPGGALSSASRRAAVRDSIAAEELTEGLLRDHGQLMTSSVPGVEGEWSRSVVRAGLDGLDVALETVGPQEVAGLTGRVLQRELRAAGAETVLVRLQPDDEPTADPDVRLVMRRDPPWPSSVRLIPQDEDAGLIDRILTADGAGPPGSERAADAEQALLDVAWVRPLYSVAAAHAWRGELVGIRPSSFPGIGFWNVVGWRWTGGSAPVQEPTIAS